MLLELAKLVANTTVPMARASAVMGVVAGMSATLTSMMTLALAVAKVLVLALALALALVPVVGKRASCLPWAPN